MKGPPDQFSDGIIRILETDTITSDCLSHFFLLLSFLRHDPGDENSSQYSFTNLNIISKLVHVVMLNPSMIDFTLK